MGWEVERMDGWNGCGVACGRFNFGADFFCHCHWGFGILFFYGRSADDSQVYSYDVVFVLWDSVVCLFVWHTPLSFF